MAADGTMTVADKADLLCHKLVRMPDWLINLVNGVGWKLNIASISLQPNAGIDMVRYPWIVSSDKLKKALDYKYSKNSREAFSDFAEYVRKEDRKTNGRSQI